MKKGWEYIDFKDVFPVKMGKTPPRGDKSSWDEKKETHNKWVSIADISNNEGKIIEDTKEYISDSAAEKINKVSKGSLLMSFKLSIGRMAFAGDDLYTNEAIIAIPENEKYILRFIYYYLLSYNWLSLTEGNEKVKGATLNKTSIGKIQLPVLSLIEQQSIVDYLDSAFAKIDAMKANAEKALNEAKALFQASLKEMLEPKEGWSEKKLKEVGRTQTGTTPSKSVANFYGGEIPFIRPAELDIDGKGGINYDSELKLTSEGALKSRVIRANSTLMCCIGSVGKTGYATQDVTCNQQINAITPYEGFNDKFVYYALLTPSFQNEVIKIANSAKATLAIISKGKWEEMSIPVPPLSEQQSIVVSLDTLNSKVARLQENYDKISQECDALKQAILRQVFE